MAKNNLESQALINTNELVCQKDPALSNITFKSKIGLEIEVSKDGCALISLYNALKISGYTKNFEEYGVELANGDCFDSNGQINWLNLNKLQLNLQFIWMQDMEIPNCERINIQRLQNCSLDSENIAIVKIQSLYGIDRRHFMVLIKVINNNAICIESSDISGNIKKRSIPVEEILGVRYLRLQKNSDIDKSKN